MNPPNLMNLPNQMSSSAPPPNVTEKRKRGRPRKDRSQNPVRSAYVSSKRDHNQNLNQNQNQNQNHGEGAPAPPGFEGINVNQQPTSADNVKNNSKEDSVIGQVVTGVIEAVFDAGYMLSVRVGNSDTSLRGVVFKPGHYVPVSAQNDVAPSLQMIRRTEVPLPSENQGKKRRGRKKSDHRSPTSSQLTRVRATQMSIVPASPHPVGERGTVVPVVLLPVNLSNGASPAVEAPHIASQPAHLAASKSKQPPLTQDAAPNGPQADSGSTSQPFDDPVDVAKKLKRPSEVAETQNYSRQSNKMPTYNSGLNSEQIQDLSKPLLVKPLQAIRCDPQDQSASIPHTFAERRTGKMTELLMAVQENLMERQMAESHHQDFKSPGK